MTWVLIGVILLLAFGPVLWLVPSRKDRRLTALRAQGRAEGLVVEIRRIPKPDPRPEERVSAGGKVRTPTLETAVYGLTMHRKLRHLPGWRIIRMETDDADPLPGWRYDRRPTGEGRRYLEPMIELARTLIEALPDDVVALEVEARMLYVYWLEKPGSNVSVVTEIATDLKEFEGALGVLEDQISAELDRNDS